MAYSVSGDNHVCGRHTCVCNQNLCDSNPCEVQQTKQIIHGDDMRTGMGQHHATKKLNPQNTMEHNLKKVTNKKKQTNSKNSRKDSSLVPRNNTSKIFIRISEA